MPASEPALAFPRPTVRSVLRLLLSLGAAVALLGWVLPKVTDTTWGQIIAVLETVPGLALLSCFVLAMAFLFSYAITLRASLPGLTIPKALIVNTAGTAVSKFLPGGGAVGLAATFLLCRSWGFSLGAVTTSAIVTGVWNTLTRVALPVLAIGLLAAVHSELPEVLRQAAWAAAISGLIILVIFVGVIWSARVANAVGAALDRLGGWVLHRGQPTGRSRRAMNETRTQILEVIKDSWHWLTLGMVGFFAAQLAIFLIALDVTGIDLAFPAVFAAFAIGRLLTAVGITPGGIGITETGTAAALVALGADPGLTAAAVVLMAIFTNLVELPFGVLAWVLWSVDPKTRVRGRVAEPQPAEPSSRRT
ncbi:MAG: flippase-like domain-containing protein [Actinomycetales bacterium]|nr:flippase-like domain-containing protein [Tetrasphaera sp.]NLX00485.1 flippase-like domain-containing protein [Actinomycetales bacterium]